MTCSKTPPAKPANLGFILQQPHLWTRRHEEYLSVKIERDVVAEKVIGETNLPRDGDEGTPLPPPFLVHYSGALVLHRQANRCV